MSPPQTPYDAVIHTARHVTAVETALDAELLGAALLGSIYAIAEFELDRATSVRDFVGRFLARTARRRTAPARTIRAVFAALAPEATGAAGIRPAADLPAWSSQLGRVRPAGTWAYGDVYGDQTSYLAVFEYEDPQLGGSEHAVVALVDHNIGIVKDLFISRPGRRVLEEMRKAADDDELVWLSEADPAVVRAELAYHLEVTDRLTVLPEQGSLATDRMLAGARLAVLPAGGDRPAPPAADPDVLGREFLDSAEAAGLERESPEAEAALQYAVRLILDFARDSPDADPLRWSPAVAGLFLLDWVHRRAVLDDDDVAVLPSVLRAWVSWCAGRRGLPAAAVAGTREAIDTMAPELERRYRDGSHRSAAARAVAGLLADGVDPDDEAAVQVWLTAHPELDAGPAGEAPGGSARNGSGPDR